jgi:hypothetical protein
VILSADAHVEPGDPIRLRQQSETRAHELVIGPPARSAALFFTEVDDLRRLRDVIDAHLVGRLGGETP